MTVLVRPAPDTGGTAIAFRERPFHLIFFVDLPLIILNILYLPAVFWPTYPPSPAKYLFELYLWDWRNVLALVEQAILLLISILAIVLPLICLVFPIPTVPFLILGVFLVFYFLLSEATGPTIMNPWADPNVPAEWRAVPEVPDEKWLFVNGICVNRHWHRLNLYRLSYLFGRRIIGIHNRTTGILFDLVECVLQRDFSYNTKDIFTLFTEAKVQLLDDNVKRVVIIGHSQGGIIVSLVLDRLFDDVPHANLKKLEIYTFGRQEFRSAANHFCSPVGESGAPLVGVMEHFTNHGDFVSRIGSLKFHMSAFPSNNFHGTLYEESKKLGHMLNQHYIDSWFAPSAGGEARISNLYKYIPQGGSRIPPPMP